MFSPMRIIQFIKMHYLVNKMDNLKERLSEAKKAIDNAD